MLEAAAPEDGKELSSRETTISWRYDSWLQAYSLNTHTVFDYFKHSPFYDRQCTNELMLMQQQRDANLLKRVAGIEYEVAAKPPDYFLIRKLRRDVDQNEETLAMYYIVGRDPDRGLCVPLPDFYHVVSTNVATCAYYLQQAVESLERLCEFQLPQQLNPSFNTGSTSEIRLLDGVFRYRPPPAAATAAASAATSASAVDPFASGKPPPMPSSNRYDSIVEGNVELFVAKLAAEATRSAS